MLAALLVLIAMAALVIGPLAWSSRRDRRGAEALVVQADIQWLVNRKLGGESLVAVMVTPPTMWRRGQVVVSVPTDWEWLMDKLWSAVIREVPAGYDLVVAGGTTATTRVPTAAVTRRAA